MTAENSGIAYFGFFSMNCKHRWPLNVTSEVLATIISHSQERNACL